LLKKRLSDDISISGLHLETLETTETIEKAENTRFETTIGAVKVSSIVSAAYEFGFAATAEGECCCQSLGKDWQQRSDKGEQRLEDAADWISDGSGCSPFPSADGDSGRVYDVSNFRTYFLFCQDCGGIISAEKWPAADAKYRVPCILEIGYAGRKASGSVRET
jgi:hypothetical protein